MKFTNSLLKGKLQRRYKRFFTDIEVNNKTVVAHCPNTGSMMGLLDQGNEAWISEHSDPKRKLKFTLEMIKVKKRIIHFFGSGLLGDFQPYFLKRVEIRDEFDHQYFETRLISCG